VTEGLRVILPGLRSSSPRIRALSALRLERGSAPPSQLFPRLRSKGLLNVVRATHDRPAGARDCTNCGLKDGIRLQNVGGTAPVNIPLLYICMTCGSTLTVPPARSPLRSI
jgi:hypothetical protein